MSEAPARRVDCGKYWPFVVIIDGTVDERLKWRSRRTESMTSPQRRPTERYVQVVFRCCFRHG